MAIRRIHFVMGGVNGRYHFATEEEKAWFLRDLAGWCSTWRELD
jgi:hypothetical protein